MEKLHEELMGVSEQETKDWRYWISPDLTRINELIGEIEHAVSSAVVVLDSAERAGEVIDGKFSGQVKRLSDLQEEVGDLFSTVYKRAKELGIEIEG